MNLKQIYDKAVKIAEIATGRKNPDLIDIQEDGCIHAIWWHDFNAIEYDHAIISEWDLLKSMSQIEGEYAEIQERKRIEAEQRKQQQLEAEKQREIELYNQLKQKYEQQ